MGRHTTYCGHLSQVDTHLGVNFSFRNVGNFPATTEGFGAQLGVIPLEQRDNACRKIQKTIQLGPKAGVIQPSLGGYQTYYIRLTESDAKGLNELGGSILCGASTIRWTDQSGKYETYGCECLTQTTVTIGSTGSFAWHSTADNNKEMKR
jgi:hypothetical protein